MAQNEATRSLSRRSFLKGTLATTAIAAGSASYLTGCTPSTQDAARSGAGEETIYSGVCRGNCYGGCHLNVHVRDGKVVRTSARELPEKEWTRICAKGLSRVYRVYDPNRIKAPMLRVEGAERGDEQWEQIT